MLVNRRWFGDSGVAVALNGGFVNNMAVRGSKAVGFFKLLLLVSSITVAEAMVGWG